MEIRIIIEKDEKLNNFDIASAVSNAIYEILDKQDNICLDYETIVKLLMVECK